MTTMRVLTLAIGVGVAVLAAAHPPGMSAQLAGTFTNRLNHPAIAYKSTPTTDPVALLNRDLDEGRTSLRFDGPSGYLRSTLDALDISVASQVAVFVQDSAQASRINRSNPRTIFFNDAVAVGWVRGGFIELAAQDPRQGVVFYSLDSVTAAAPRFRRREDCLSCHHSYSTVGVPGMLARSSGEFTVDHRLPLDRRWGGWWVTSARGDIAHLGNLSLDRIATAANTTAPTVPSFEGRFDTSGYLSTQSDIAALMVFDHQMHAMNLLGRIGWEARVAEYQRSAALPSLAPAKPSGDDSLIAIEDAAREVVDYFLFIDEAPLPGALQGASGFTEQFSARGPFDAKGRSLRQLDLETRLLRYPCSYMIYSDLFDALPAAAKSAIYQRLANVLAGRDGDARYNRLSGADRQAILEILRATKKDLPAYFG